MSIPRTTQLSETPWKTAVGLNAFMSSMRKYDTVYPDWEVLDRISRFGFDGVELAPDWPLGGYPRANEPERMAALQRMFDYYDLDIFAIQTSATDAFSPDDSVRRRWLEDFEQWAVLAKGIGCECLGTWPDGELGDQTLDEATARFTESLNAAARIADGLGLTLGFELEPVFIFKELDHLDKIMAEAFAGTSPLKMIYDHSHFDWLNGGTGKPHELLERIGVEHISYVHLTDTDGTQRPGGSTKHLGCGDGYIDLDASYRTLLDGGFRGWVMVDAWAIPDVYDAFEKGISSIQSFLSQRVTPPNHAAP